MNAIDLKRHIRTVPDFPRPGILFYDLGTLLAHGPAWTDAVNRLTEMVREDVPDMLLAVESRGFLPAAPVAAALGIGLVMVRKKGKLPGETESHSYTLEYGTDTVEIQKGVLRPGQKAVLVDDLLATGGTAAAAIALARKMGASVTGAVFLVELAFLRGRGKIDVPVKSLVSYDE